MKSPFLKNEVSYDFDTNSKTIIINLRGEISSSVINKINKQIINDPRFTREFNWIFDVHNTKQLFEPDSVKVFLDLFSKNLHLFDNTKMVFIYNTPKQSISIDNLADLISKNKLRISIKKVHDMRQANDWLLNQD